MVTRPFAAVFLFAMCSQLTGCVVRTNTMVRPSDLRPEERGAPALRVAGVTLEGGQSYLFDTIPAPRLTSDTLYANRDGVPLAIPRQTIRDLIVVLPGGSLQPVATSNPDGAADSILGRRIVSVTTRDGAEVRFDRAMAVYVQGDTVYGSVGGASRRIPFADAKGFKVRGRNATLSGLATLGVAAAGVGAVVVVWGVLGGTGDIIPWRLGGF
jgi:hypothetical protein